MSDCWSSGMTVSSGNTAERAESTRESKEGVECCGILCVILVSYSSILSSYDHLHKTYRRLGYQHTITVGEELHIRPHTPLRTYRQLMIARGRRDFFLPLLSLVSCNNPSPMFLKAILIKLTGTHGRGVEECESRRGTSWEEGNQQQEEDTREGNQGRIA